MTDILEKSPTYLEDFLKNSYSEKSHSFPDGKDYSTTNSSMKFGGSVPGEAARSTKDSKKAMTEYGDWTEGDIRCRVDY